MQRSSRALLLSLAAVAVLLGASGPATAAPRLARGVLSAPSSRPVAEIARAYLATRPAALGTVEPEGLTLDRVHPLPGGGALVRFAQRSSSGPGGLDVIGAGVAVRVDSVGRVRWAHAKTVTIPAAFDPAPHVTAAAAWDAVRRGPAANLGLAALDPRNARLVIFAPGPAAVPRLAWLLRVPASLARMESLRVFVDAQDGRVLSRENLVRHGAVRTANVYPHNPVVDVATVVASIESDVDVTSDQLVGPDIVGSNCIDNRACQTITYGGMNLSVHACDMVSHATADPANRNFLAIMRPPSDLAPEDDFAEVQMFYHATRAHSFFEGLGLTALSQRPMRAVANLRIPDLNNPLVALCTGATANPASVLVPFDNAAFFPAGGLGGFPDEDMILFGQGSTLDFAYDGDVVAHEMTHAVMGTIAPFYAAAVPDALGLDLTPGGTMEGYSDYFSSVIHGDPVVGDYALDGLGAGRTLDNAKRCPDDLIGEVHADGEPWGGALWEIRGALPERRRAEFDAAVYAAVEALGTGDSPIGDTPAVIAAEIELRIGPAAANLATMKFAARGWDDCNDRVIDLSDGARKQVLFLQGTDTIGIDTMIPAVVSFRLVLPEDARAIHVDVSSSQAGGTGLPGTGGQPAVSVLVKAGGVPIAWTWGSGSEHDAEYEAELALTAGGGEVTINGDFPAGTYHVQLANAGTTVIALGIGLGYTAGSLTPDAGPVDAGAGDAGDAGGDESSGCGCRAAPATGTSGTRLLLTSLAVLGVALTLRRRSGRRPHAR